MVEMFWKIGLSGGRPERLMSSTETPKDTENMSDEELLGESFKSPWLFEVIVRRYQDAFLRKAKTITKNEEASEDIVQDTFVKIYMHGRKFEKKEGASFKSWAYKILLNTCFTWYKKMKRENEFFSTVDVEIDEIMTEGQNSSSESWLDREYLLSIIKKLPDAMARVLYLYVVEGKKYKAIAKIENVSEGAIKTRFHRAKNDLRKLASEIQY